MKLEQKYFLTVIGDYERKPLVFEEHPTEQEIIKAISEEKGKSARVEKRFVLTEKVSG